MAFEDNIQDQARQRFLKEALGSLKEIKGALLAFYQDPNSAQIDTLVQAAYNLNDRAARLNLTDIETLAHPLNGIFQVLQQRKIEIDTELINLLLQAHNCLRLALLAQMQLSQDDQTANLVQANYVFAQLEAKLDPALPIDGNPLTVDRSDANGTRLSPATELSQLLEQLETVLTQPEMNQLPALLNTQAKALANVSERLELPEFEAIAQTLLASLQTNPQAAKTIGKLALAGFRAAQTALLKSRMVSLETMDTQKSGGRGVERALKTAELFIWVADAMVFFLPYASIKEHLAPEADQIIRSRNQQFLHWRDHMIRLYLLSDLCKDSLSLKTPSGKNNHGLMLTLVISQGLQHVALKSPINRLVIEQTLMVRDLDRIDPSPKYLYGYTYLENENWAPVVDVKVLVESINNDSEPVISPTASSLNSPNAELNGDSKTGAFHLN